MISQRPDARDFARMNDFLEATYQWRKSQERDFSYSSWARELGLNSRVFLKLIVTGKRSITERSLPLFLEKLQLSPAETPYFTALARLERATSARERETQLSELCRYRKIKNPSSPILDHYEFLSSPLAIRVQTTLTFEKGGWRASEIAELLSVKISEVQSCLRTLQKLSIAKEESEDTSVNTSRWFATLKQFEIPDQWGNEALQTLHRKSLEAATQAIGLPPEERRFQVLNLFLTPEELEETNQRVIEFYNTLMERYSNTKPSGARLYQAHLSLVPVSATILQAERSQPAPVVILQPTNKKMAEEAKTL